MKAIRKVNWKFNRFTRDGKVETYSLGHPLVQFYLAVLCGRQTDRDLALRKLFEQDVVVARESDVPVVEQLGLVLLRKILVFVHVLKRVELFDCEVRNALDPVHNLSHCLFEIRRVAS